MSFVLNFDFMIERERTEIFVVERYGARHRSV